MLKRFSRIKSGLLAIATVVVSGFCTGISYYVWAGPGDFAPGDSVAVHMDQNGNHGRLKARFVRTQVDRKAVVQSDFYNHGDAFTVSLGSISAPLPEQYVSLWGDVGLNLARNIKAAVEAAGHTARLSRIEQIRAMSKPWAQGSSSDYQNLDAIREQFGNKLARAFREDPLFRSASRSLLLKMFFEILETYPVSQVCAPMNEAGLNLFEMVFSQNDLQIPAQTDALAIELALRKAFMMKDSFMQARAGLFIWNCLGSAGQQRIQTASESVSLGSGVQKGLRILALGKATTEALAAARSLALEVRSVEYLDPMEREMTLRPLLQGLHQILTSLHEVTIGSQRFLLANPDRLPIVKAVRDVLQSTTTLPEWDAALEQAGFKIASLMNLNETVDGTQ